MYNLSNISKRNVSQAKGDRKLPLVFGYFSVLFFSGLLLGCSGNGEEQTVTVSQLNDILASNQHPCKEALISVGNDLIGSKEHLLQLEALPSLTIGNEAGEKVESSKIKTDTAEKNIAQTDTGEQLSQSSPLMLSGILLYKDRPTHVRFNATLIQANQSQKALPQQTGKAQCLVSYQLNYHFNDPCMTIREEVFKKWNQIAQLNDNTRYYVHKRHPNRKAYLTNLDRNLQCLVSVNDSQRFEVK